VAWYCRLYAPRTGGAYDSHYRTAGIDSRSRRCGGCVAAEQTNARGVGGKSADGGDRARGQRAAPVVSLPVSADEILGRPAFPYTREKTDVELALLSAAELGVESESAALSDVYKRARQVGLELCPAEVAPKLRLDYRDQPLGDALNIAMEPVATHSGEPTILALVNFGTGLALIGSDGRSKFMVPRTWRFVFALPTHDRLEAMRETPQIVPE
jgi:hypothetical protein